MTVIGDIAVPAIPGTCYHAILCSLMFTKNKFVTWNKLSQLVEEYLLRYGGDDAWNKFAYRSSGKSRGKIDEEHVLKKIKTNTHTLTRTGKNCYGYRLHVRGIAIYYFRDGSMIRTGGKYVPARGRRPYAVKFKDGTGLQTRSRGKIMSHREYKDFVSNIKMEDESGF